MTGNQGGNREDLEHSRLLFSCLLSFSRLSLTLRVYVFTQNARPVTDIGYVHVATVSLAVSSDLFTVCIMDGFIFFSGVNH